MCHTVITINERHQYAELLVIPKYKLVKISYSKSSIIFYSTREVSGRGQPAVGLAAADFPWDVCTTVSRNHKVFLFYHEMITDFDATNMCH